MAARVTVAKNKGKFGKGKSEVVLEDEFISGIERITERLRPYALRIVIVIGTVLLVAIGWVLYDWHQTGKSEDATMAYARALAILDARVMPPAPEGEESPSAEPGTYESAEARRTAALEALSAVRSSFGSTGVADQARLIQASVLYGQGRAEDAGKLYAAFASDTSGALAVIGREGSALAIESEALAAEDAAAREQGLSEALAAFEAMQPDPEGPLYARALYHQARILAIAGRREEAAARYRSALEPAAGLPLEASIQLALDELGVPAPPPADTANEEAGEEAAEASAEEAAEAPAKEAAAEEAAAPAEEAAAEEAAAPAEEAAAEAPADEENGAAALPAQ